MAKKAPGVEYWHPCWVDIMRAHLKQLLAGNSVDPGLVDCYTMIAWEADAPVEIKRLVGRLAKKFGPKKKGGRRRA